VSNLNPDGFQLSCCRTVSMLDFDFIVALWHGPLHDFRVLEVVMDSMSTTNCFGHMVGI